MKRVIITKDFLKSLKCIKMNNGVIEYINDKNETIVLFSSSYLELNRLLNIDLEAKIINEEKYFISDEVVVPDTILYDFTGNVIGYKTVRVKGNKLSSMQNNMNNNANVDDERMKQTQSQMKMMNYTLPVLSGYIAYQVPLGLGLYWLFSNMLQIVQQYVMNNMMKDEEPKLIEMGADKIE